MSMKLYVGGLAYSTTEDELKAIFAEVGEVMTVAVIKDRDTQQSKGFGFVEMKEDEDGQTAIKDLNGKEVGGRSIVVNQARPQENRPHSGGGSFQRS